ncbi:MAG: TolC family protein [Nitrospirota bacterium]
MKDACRRIKRVSMEVTGKTLFVVFMFFSLAMISFSEAHAEILTLPEGLRLAAERSRIIKIAESEELISESDAMIARSKMLPEINAFLSQTSLAHQPAAVFGPQTVPVSERNFLSYSLNIQQTLFDFKGNASRYGASKAILNSKKLDTKRLRNLVAIDFVLAYLDLLEAEKMLAVADKEVERLESHLHVAKSLYDEGVITKNDLLQAEVKISDARQRLLTAKSLRKINASRLNNILQRPLLAEIEIMDINGLSADITDIDLEKAWEIAEKDRAEVQIVNETLRSLDMEETAKRSEYFPKLFLKGSYDYTENRYQVHEGNWSLSLGMGINLFRGGSTRGEILKLEFQKEKLLEQKNKLIDEIKLEVEKYMLDIRTARERVAVTGNAVQQAEENLRINRIKYEEGVGTATDVLDAVSLLTVAETNYHRSIYDLRKAEAAALYATGKELLEVYK